MPNRPAKASADSCEREPTAATVSPLARMSDTNCSAIQPVPRMPQRSDSVMSFPIERVPESVVRSCHARLVRPVCQFYSVRMTDVETLRFDGYTPFREWLLQNQE